MSICYSSKIWKMQNPERYQRQLKFQRKIAKLPICDKMLHLMFQNDNKLVGR